jgi:hypothetical protein
MTATAADMARIVSRDGLAGIGEAALRAVNVAGKLARFESYHATAAQLGFDFSAYFNVSRAQFPRDPAGYQEYLKRGEQRALYEGRVDRALVALADAGTIRRVRRGEPGPDGYTAREAGYWSHSAWDLAENEAERAAAAAAELRTAWEEIHNELADRFGVVVSGARWQPPRLDLDEWRRLLAATRRNEIE